jgi:hypothetical protein
MFANRSDQLSWRLHQAVAEALMQNPEKISIAQHHAQRWSHPPATAHQQHWAQAWLPWLHKPLPELCRFLLENSDHAQQMRSSSPFVGILSQKQRMAILKGLEAEENAKATA